MNSFFKAFKLRLPGVYFGIPMPKRAIPGAWRTGEAKKFLCWLDLLGSQKTSAKPSAAKATPAGEINVSTAPIKIKATPTILYTNRRALGSDS